MAAAHTMAILSNGSYNFKMTATPDFRIWSPAFKPGEAIPEPYSRSGANLSPPLIWTAPPEESQSLCLIVFDPDAPRFWYHWLLYNMPPNWRELPENFLRQRESYGVYQGKNSFYQLGYDGPEPPAGEQHRYFFRLYALKQKLSLRAGAPGDLLAQQLQGKVLAKTEVQGYFGQKSLTQDPHPLP